MATLTIPDSTLRRLQALAAARQISVDAYLEEIAQQGAAATDSARQLAALQSFTSGMTTWTVKHLPPGHMVDDSRESIYADRGE